jgi:hypothetical protein
VGNGTAAVQLQSIAFVDLLEETAVTDISDETTDSCRSRGSATSAVPGTTL